MDRNEDLFLMTFSDFWTAVKKAKKNILSWALIFAALAFLYAVTRPIEYVVQSSFKEKGTKESGLGGNALSSLLGGADGTKSEAIAVMKSHKLLQEVIKKHQIQGVLVKEEWKFPLFKRMKDNLRVEYAYFRNRLIPVLKDAEEPVMLTSLDYAGEVPINLKIRFLPKAAYSVFDKDDNQAGIGQLGSPFHFENATFTLYSANPDRLEGQSYDLTLKALAVVAKDLIGRFNIEADSLNKSILKMTYKCSDRHLACLHLNTLMNAYQQFLYKEHQRIAHEQIAYLENRHDTMGQNLRKMMEAFAERVSVDVSNTGFMNTEAGMHFLAEALQKHKQRLLDINMEIEKLQKAKSSEIIFLERTGDPQVVNAILTEIRTLKQECDGLTLAIRRASETHAQANKEQFLSQIEEFEITQKHAEEAHILLASLNENHWQETSLHHLNHPDYFVNLWFNKLTESYREFQACEEPLKHSQQQEFEACKSNFTSYLNQLVHYFDVRQKALRERISRQQLPQDQFQGIGLPTAHALYIQYSNEKGNAETLLKQKEFMITQLEDDAFEVSSLSSLLTDSVSRQMIDRASTLALSLQDDSNRSAKEHSRLRDELNVQKKFLKSHLKQTQQLGQLQIELLTDKILALQNIILELDQQKISILQAHLSDFLQSRLMNLQQEKELVNHQLQNLQLQLHQMPSRWISEKMINQQMTSNQMMVEELTRLVESKNIASNLEIIQSAPLDLAEPPLHPRSPHLFLLTMLGAFFGTFFGIGKVAYNSIVEGIPASEENFMASGFTVVGRLSKLFDERHPSTQDCDTLRKVAAFIHPNSSQKSHQVVLLLDGNGPEYCRALATLLSKAGLKILILPLTQTKKLSGQGNGLLSYLEGGSALPEILNEACFDSVLAGKSSLYETELLTSPRFKDYLAAISGNYDYIFVISHASMCHSEAESLLKNYETAVISLGHETLNDLKMPCRSILEEKDSMKRAFLFIEPA
jgi:hypothetical protein